MPDLYLLHFDDLLVAVYKQGLELLHDVKDIHKLPLVPAEVAGVLIVDEHKTALADLALLLGRRPYQAHDPGHILLLSDRAIEAGFVISADITEHTVEGDAVTPLPVGLARPEMKFCVHLDELRVVPLIDLQVLNRYVHDQEAVLPSPPSQTSERQLDKIAGVTELRLFKVGGELFAVPFSPQTTTIVCPESPCPLPHAPSYVKGLSALDSNVVVIVDLANKLRLTSPSGAGHLLTCDSTGVEIEEDMGTIGQDDFAWRTIPPLVASPWILAMVSYQDQIVPVVDPAGLFAEAGEGGEPSLPDRYCPDSPFASRFTRQDLEVLEFMLLGNRHALPKTEVVDVVDMLPLRHVPGLDSLTIGVVDYDGEVIPVLDLAMVFARRSLVSPDWQLILIENGDFRAFVLSEKVCGERSLGKEMQRGVPTLSSRKLVYGCYPDGDTVRLILNTMALAVHFDRVVVNEFISSLTSEMETAPAEIIADLLPPGDLEEEQIRQDREEEDERQRQIAAEENRRAEQQRRQDEEAKRQEAEEQQRHRDAEDQARQEEQERHRQAEEARRVEEERHQEERRHQAVLEKEKQMAAEASARQEELQRQEDLAQAEEEGRRLEMAKARRLLKEVEETYLKQADRRGGLRWLIPVLFLVAGLVYFMATDNSKEGQDEKSSIKEQAPSVQQTILPQEQQPGVSGDQSLPEQPAAALEALVVKEPEPVDNEYALEYPPVHPEGEKSLTDAAGLRADNAEQGVEEDVRTEEAGAGQPMEDGEKNGVLASPELLPAAIDSEEDYHALDQPPLLPGSTEAGLEELPMGKQQDGTSEVVVENDQKEAPIVNDALENIPPPLVITVPADLPLLRETYTVKKGDTLWDISTELTGDPYNFMDMAQENKIKNPDLIFPEQEIQLKKLEPDQDGRP